jgi:hypothetical protein
MCSKVEDAGEMVVVNFKVLYCRNEYNQRIPGISVMLQRVGTQVLGLNTLQKEIAWQSETRKENAMTLHGAESLF